MPKPGRRGGGAKPGARALKGRGKKSYDLTRADDVYEAEDSDKEAALEKSGRYDVSGSWLQRTEQLYS